MVASRRRHSSASSSAIDRSTWRSTGMPSTSIRASTRTRGSSIRSWRSASPSASSACPQPGAESGEDRGQPGRRQVGGGHRRERRRPGRHPERRARIPLPRRAGAVVDLHPEVVARQVGEPVVVGRGIEQVGRHRGVHGQPVHVHPEGQERAHELLGVVGHDADAPLAEGRGQGGGHRSVVHRPGAPVGAGELDRRQLRAVLRAGSATRVRLASGDRPASPAHRASTRDVAGAGPGGGDQLVEGPHRVAGAGRDGDRRRREPAGGRRRAPGPGAPRVRRPMAAGPAEPAPVPSAPSSMSDGEAGPDGSELELGEGGPGLLARPSRRGRGRRCGGRAGRRGPGG